MPTHSFDLSLVVVVQAFDLQSEINKLEEVRKQRRAQQLDQIRKALLQSQEMLKVELETNRELKAQD